MADADPPNLEVLNTESSTPKAETPDTGTPTPDAEASDASAPTSNTQTPDANPSTKIPAPQNYLTMKAGEFAVALPYGHKDHVIANRIFRRVYNKHFAAIDENWRKVPQEIIDSAVEELVETNIRLFSIFEDNWYLIWGLRKRHQGRGRSRKWGEEEDQVAGESSRQE